MTDLTIFNNPQFGELRTVEQNGKIYFVAVDVCNALEIKNNRDALARLDDDEKDVVLTDTLGGKQSLATVNEYGLYSLVLTSRKPEAKAFKRWITHEVLPSIRKNGMYGTPQTIEDMIANPDYAIKLLVSLKEERAKHAETSRQLEAAKPKVIFADAVSASPTTILVSDLAKLIKQNGYPIGEKRLFKWLRDNGYLIKRKCADYNSPTQRSMEMGLFEKKMTAITHSDGRVTTSCTSRVTGKGQQYFVNKFVALKGGVAQ